MESCRNSLPEYLKVNSQVNLALLSSRVILPNDLMTAAISDGGFSLNVPFWGDLLSPADAGDFP